MFKNQDKTLVILDLDETLLHASIKELEHPADYCLFNYHIYLRPFLADFLAQLPANFLVAVWSSGSDDYVDGLIPYLFPANYPLEFVWGNSQCTPKSSATIDEWGYYQIDPTTPYYFIKRLQKLKKKGYHLDRILIVDDSPYKVQENYGNAIYPTPYLGAVDDNELYYLGYYLNYLKDVRHLRAVEKRGWRSFVEQSLL